MDKKMLLMPTGPAGPKQPTHPHTAHQHVTAAHIYWLQGMMQHQMNAHAHAMQIMHSPGRPVMSHLGHKFSKVSCYTNKVSFDTLAWFGRLAMPHHRHKSTL